MPAVWNIFFFRSEGRALAKLLERLAELMDERTDGIITLDLFRDGLSPIRENSKIAQS